MTTYINLFGGPGSGKSTIAAGLFYEMKMLGLNVELVTEFARDLVYSNNLDVLFDQQEYVFAEQNNRMHRLRDKVDWVITDSPLLLSAVYPEINRLQKNAKPWSALEEFKKFVYAQVNTYNNLNVFLKRPENGFSSAGRLQDLEQAKEIDQLILKELESIGVTSDNIAFVNANASTVKVLLNSLRKNLKADVDMNCEHCKWSVVRQESISFEPKLRCTNSTISFNYRIYALRNIIEPLCFEREKLEV